MTARHTEDKYKDLARSLGLTWCGPHLPKNTKDKTNWSCSEPEHPEFPATFNDLTKIRREHKSSGCVYCSGKKAAPSSSLATLEPDIAALWHPTKNNLLTADDVTPGSNRKVYWLCSQDIEHVRRATVVYAVQRGIPKCRQCNLISVKRPDLMAEWHPTRNNDLSPDEVVCGSAKPVWWRCRFNRRHEWRAAPNNRTAGDSGCPDCNKRSSKLEIRVYTELLTLFPDALWGELVDGKECDVLIPSINIGIEIDGAYFHANKADKDSAKNKHFKSLGVHILRLREHPLPKISEHDIQHKKNDRSLSLVKRVVRRLQELRSQIADNAAAQSYLSRKKLAALEHYRDRLAGLQFPPFEKSLEHLYPQAASTWDYELNGSFTPQMFRPGSEQEVYWHCPVEGHPSFRYPIKRQRKHNGCPICTGRQVTDDTSVATKLDRIDVLWHPTKNLPDTPKDVRHKEASRKVWWLCPECGHEWEALPNNVIHVGTGCEPCSDRRGARKRIKLKIAKEGSLADRRPDIVAFIDSARSPEIDASHKLPGSNASVYIKCPKCAFEWPKKRTLKDLRRIVDSHNCIQSLSQRFPDLSIFWDRERNSNLNPDNIPSNSQQKYYWRCINCGFEWAKPSSIRNFARHGMRTHDCSTVLQVAFPDIVKFWDWDRNTLKGPNQITKGSRTKIFLMCTSCGHQFKKPWVTSDVTLKGFVCKNCGARFSGVNRRQKQPITTA